jgi:tetratricopeptide (TPR) repeat protein
MPPVDDRPLCFVLMPFGSKPDPGGGPNIDFDSIYEKALRPGIEAAGMEAIRADEERTGGIVHKAMFERLLLCDFAVADLTTANANVFYELGVRHATRPATTLAIFASQQRLPFDLNYLRSLPYTLAEKNAFGDAEADALRTAITGKLTQLRELAQTELPSDSPLFQLLTEYQAPDIARLKTDSFRDRVRYSTHWKHELAQARRAKSVPALDTIQASLGHLDGVEAGVLVDLFLSYRALSAFSQMEMLFQRLPVTLQRTVLLREQLAFALNRLKRRQEAADLLERVLAEQGASSETLGLMGRIYKDLWVEASKAGDTWRARGYLDRAIATYTRGFEADFRDAYPGINAVTLLDIKGDLDSLRTRDALLPVIRYAVTQRLRGATPDYWDHATWLELAVLASERQAAEEALTSALATDPEAWQRETTANNLSLIQDARLARGTREVWLDAIISALPNART